MLADGFQEMTFKVKALYPLVLVIDVNHDRRCKAGYGSIELSQTECFERSPVKSDHEHRRVAAVSARPIKQCHDVPVCNCWP